MDNLINITTQLHNWYNNIEKNNPNKFLDN